MRLGVRDGGTAAAHRRRAESQRPFSLRVSLVIIPIVVFALVQTVALAESILSSTPFDHGGFEWEDKITAGSNNKPSGMAGKSGNIPIISASAWNSNGEAPRHAGSSGGEEPLAKAEESTLAAAPSSTSGKGWMNRDGGKAATQTTPYSGFWSGVVTSVSLTVITELGDRTFFIAALMSLKYSKILVLIGAVAALISQTIISIFIGRLLHLLPSSSTRAISSIPLDDYGAGIMLFIFGMLHLRAAFRPPASPSVHSRSQVDNLSSRPLSSSGTESELWQQQQQQLEFNEENPGGEYVEAKETVDRVQYFHLGNRPAAWAVVKETFWVVFIAEVGDKSMISTIALATAQNPFGVLLGAALAHTILTIGAIVAGSVLQRYISDKVANVIGGVLFLSYALLTIMEGLARQGIPLWGFAVQKTSTFFFAYFTAAAVGSSVTSITKDTLAGFLRGVM